MTAKPAKPESLPPSRIILRWKDEADAAEIELTAKLREQARLSREALALAHEIDVLRERIANRRNAIARLQELHKQRGEDQP